MRKFIFLLAAAILAISSAGIITAFAFSGSVSIEGDRQVAAGAEYTYTITVSVENAGAVIANIDYSGVFRKESGENMIEWSEVANSSGVIYTGSLTVSVPTTAKPGDTGTISVSGSVVSYINDEHDTDEKAFSGSFTAEVASDSAAPEPSEWDAALSSVQAMKAGGKLSLDITQSAVIPAEVLSVLKEKQGTLTLGLDGYSCVIDGNTLTGIPGGIKAADITISMEKEKALSAVANGQDIYQLNFAHEGQLPGKFRFSFAAAESKPGDVLYLYRYYSGSGVLEGVGASAVDGNGTAAFDIYYCSGYVVSGSVIEGAAGSLGSGSALDEQLQAQLAEAYAANGELKSQFENLNSQLEDATAAAAFQTAHYQGMLNLSPPLFIAIIAGALLTAALLTTIIFKMGLFAPRKAVSSRTITVKEYRSKQQ